VPVVADQQPTTRLCCLVVTLVYVHVQCSTDYTVHLHFIACEFFAEAVAVVSISWWVRPRGLVVVTGLRPQRRMASGLAMLHELPDSICVKYALPQYTVLREAYQQCCAVAGGRLPRRHKENNILPSPGNTVGGDQTVRLSLGHAFPRLPIQMLSHADCCIHVHCKYGGWGWLCYCSRDVQRA
jgi:hypothetical protein